MPQPGSPFVAPLTGLNLTERLALQAWNCNGKLRASRIARARRGLCPRPPDRRSPPGYLRTDESGLSFVVWLFGGGVFPSFTIEIVDKILGGTRSYWRSWSASDDQFLPGPVALIEGAQRANRLTELCGVTLAVAGAPSWLLLTRCARNHTRRQEDAGCITRAGQKVAGTARSHGGWWATDALKGARIISRRSAEEGRCRDGAGSPEPISSSAQILR